MTGLHRSLYAVRYARIKIKPKPTISILVSHAIFAGSSTNVLYRSVVVVDAAVVVTGITIMTSDVPSMQYFCFIFRFVL